MFVEFMYKPEVFIFPDVDFEIYMLVHSLSTMIKVLLFTSCDKLLPICLPFCVSGEHTLSVAFAHVDCASHV